MVWKRIPFEQFQRELIEDCQEIEEERLRKKKPKKAWRWYGKKKHC